MAKLKPVAPDNIAIYALIDPFTDEVRYIGKSIRPKLRLRAHVSSPQINLKTRNAEWLRGLLAQNAMPKMTILEVATVDTWRQAEIRWVAHYRAAGANLNNIDAGGVGPIGKIGITPPTFAARFKGENSQMIQAVLKETNETFEEMMLRLIKQEAARVQAEWPDNMLAPEQTIQKANQARWPKDNTMEAEEIINGFALGEMSTAQAQRELRAKARRFLSSSRLQNDLNRAAREEQLARLMFAGADALFATQRNDAPYEQIDKIAIENGQRAAKEYASMMRVPAALQINLDDE